MQVEQIHLAMGILPPYVDISQGETKHIWFYYPDQDRKNYAIYLRCYERSAGWFLDEVHVKEQYRRKGFARAALQFFEEKFGPIVRLHSDALTRDATKNPDGSWATPYADNITAEQRAAFYTKLGFTEDPLRPNFFSKPTNQPIK